MIIILIQEINMIMILIDLLKLKEMSTRFVFVAQSGPLFFFEDI